MKKRKSKTEKKTTKNMMNKNKAMQKTRLT